MIGNEKQVSRCIWRKEESQGTSGGRGDYDSRLINRAEMEIMTVLNVILSENYPFVDSSNPVADVSFSSRSAPI